MSGLCIHFGTAYEVPKLYLCLTMRLAYTCRKWHLRQFWVAWLSLKAFPDTHTAFEQRIQTFKEIYVYLRTNQEIPRVAIRMSDKVCYMTKVFIKGKGPFRCCIEYM